MSKSAKRIGDIQVVENKDKHFAANSEYFHIRVQKEDGEEISLLFTERELSVAKERARKNPEDLPKVGFFRDLFD